MKTFCIVYGVLWICSYVSAIVYYLYAMRKEHRNDKGRSNK